MPSRLTDAMLTQLVARLEQLQVPKAFVALVVLVHFSGNLGCFDHEIQYMELYAGAANVWRAVSQSYPSVRADLTYGSSSQPESKQNPMDVLTSAGFAICIWLVLQCAEKDFFGLLAIVCSSWVPVNIATSKRSVALPEGNISLNYVANANCMCSRSVLICILIVARGGTFFLEQPGGSYMEYFDKMRWLYERVPVFKVAWWMGHYGHASPKRHKAFTNNKWPAKFNLGKMHLKRFRASQNPDDKPTVRYLDKKGRPRFHGNAKLKQSQIYPMRFGWKTLELMPKLKSRGLGMPDLPESLPTGPEIFNSMSWHDDMDWSDAHLKPVLVYLRGNKSLDLPDSWKAVFPRRI